ncbi:MAG: hypothetical protein IJN92_10215 [Lachnospiraceae bacterium]|nr:hypothetical protein [Lachnospiraceae bacterium]
MSQENLSELERLQAEKEELKKEMKAWTQRIHAEQDKLKQEKSLYEMKFKLLEADFLSLAQKQEEFRREKEQFEREKAYYKSYSSQDFYEEESEIGDFYDEGAFFFKGVTSPLGLKKRYKDLIKIFHPDNLFGDTDTIKKINLEYEKMKEYLQVKIEA